MTTDRLLKCETLYCQLVENASDGLWVIDLELKTQCLNSRMSDILGYSAAEMMGRPFQEFLDSNNKMLFGPAFERSERAACAIERRLLRKDGTYVWCRVKVVPIQNPGGAIAGALAIVTDTSVHKELEEQLRQAQKMDMIGRLAGGIAHDFNNILSVLQLAIDSLEDAERLPSEMQVIKEAAARGARLTRQILSFSRKQAPVPESLDLNEHILNIKNMLARLIGENIRFDAPVTFGLWKIMADPCHVDQIMMNLVVNARDAMPQGGVLRITTANERIAPEGAVDGLSEGDYVAVQVIDSGYGMTPDVMSKVFNPFFTTKANGKGLGLGLSTVHGIVRQNGGTIQVSSIAGEGSKFKVLFPRACPSS